MNSTGRIIPGMNSTWRIYPGMNSSDRKTQNVRTLIELDRGGGLCEASEASEASEGLNSLTEGSDSERGVKTLGRFV